MAINYGPNYPDMSDDDWQNEIAINRDVEDDGEPLFAPKGFWREVFESMAYLAVVALALFGTEQFCFWLIRFFQGR